ncbi:TPA: hypothetical protein ACGGSL_003515 [Vibrio cholerae]
MKLNPNKTKKHHFVAQCIQREFALDAEKLKIFGFSIRCKSKYMLGCAQLFDIEHNLQSVNLHTLQHLENSEQINLEQVFGILEDQVARNIKMLNSIDLINAEGNVLEAIIKNILSYFLLDYMRNPHRKSEILSDFLKLPKEYQALILNKLEHSALSHTDDYHTKLLALALLSVEKYTEELANFISGTRAWISSTLFTYDDSKLLNGGVALSDMSVVHHKFDDGNFIYVNAISRNKFLVSEFDSSKLVINDYSKKRRSRPHIQVKHNDMNMLAAYNKLTIGLSYGYVYSNSEQIYGVQNIN